MEKKALLKSITEKHTAEAGMEVMRDGTSGTIGAIGITRLFMAQRSCTNLYDPSLFLTGFMGVL